VIAAALGCLAFVGVPATLAKVPFALYLDSGQPWWLGVPIFLLGLVIPMLAFGMMALILSRVGKLTAWFLETMRIPRVHSDRLLIVRGPSDEATSLINLFHALELLVTAIWGRRGPFDRVIEAACERVWAACRAIWSAIPQFLSTVATIWLRAGALICFAAIVAVGVVTVKFPAEVHELWRTAWVPFPSLRFISYALTTVQHYASSMLPEWLVITIAIGALPTFALFLIFGALLSAATSVGIVLGLLFVMVILCTASWRSPVYPSSDHALRQL
jgi:hypothetical protein